MAIAEIYGITSATLNRLSNLSNKQVVRKHGSGREVQPKQGRKEIAERSSTLVAKHWDSPEVP